jgi:hypothetical protein
MARTTSTTKNISWTKKTAEPHGDGAKAEAGHWISAAEAAKLLRGRDVGVVSALLEKGLLSRRPVSKAVLVSRASVEAFWEKYGDCFVVQRLAGSVFWDGEKWTKYWQAAAMFTAPSLADPWSDCDRLARELRVRSGLPVVAAFCPSAEVGIL